MIKFFFQKFIKKLKNLLGSNFLEKQLLELKILSSKSYINQIKIMSPIKELSDVEFKVFSQFGDDGILQYLIHFLNIPSNFQTFVEFGVENYEEANTRFLLMNNNWRGLIMDGLEKNIQHVTQSSYYWQHDITAKAAFIDKENINELISNSGFYGDIGILSIDIDGNDYWIWNEIEVVNPIIVVVEYNGSFGYEFPLSVPYDKAFVRSNAHYSNLYWGCSLAALNHLAVKKGYVFSGCNGAGNNAYFVRNDYVNNYIPRPSLENGFKEPKFRESRNESGSLTFLNSSDRLKVIRDLPLINVVTGETNYINKIFKV